MFSIDNGRCIQCGTCINDCHRQALSMVDGSVVHDPEKCMWCGHCLALCPRDCIIIDGDGYNCEDVEEIGFGKGPSVSQIRNMILIRRSVRHFTDDPVTDDELGYIFEAGKYSPTGRNIQGNAFIAVTDDKVSELAEDTYAAFRRLLEKGALEEPYLTMISNLCSSYEETGADDVYYNAPIVIFVFADTDVDGAICATNMGWMAQAQQIGYCFARIPAIAMDDEEFAAKWEAYEGKKCVIALLIGNSENEYFCSVPRHDPPVVVF